MRKFLAITAVSVSVFCFATACSPGGGSSGGPGRSGEISVDVNDENAQQIGDAMASIDEAGGAMGALAFDSAPMIPSQSCMGYGYGACTGNTITRVFNGCSVGSSKHSGTVGLTWTGSSANCTLGAPGDSIRRVPNFSITGSKGGTLKVSKTGSNGQTLTWTGGSGANKAFDFTNDGINRKITFGGTTYYDVTSQTSSTIVVSGSDRSGRVMSGGTLRLTNNLSGGICDISPSNVTWEPGCNCATSGTWSGNCGGQAFSVALNGCGSAMLTVGTSTQAVTFDRCSPN